MNRQTIRLRAAENWGLLADDGLTMIQSKLTPDRVNNQINIQLQDVVGPILINENPEGSQRFTKPQNTYTATTTVASVSGATITFVDDVIRNDMDGFEIENTTKGVKGTILSVSDTNEVILTDTPDDDWTGDTVYILGNEFVLIGDVVDLREIVGIRIKYYGTENYWTPLERYTDFHSGRVEDEDYSILNPKWYPTSMKFDGRIRNAFGIKPHPVTKNGLIALTYTQKPLSLEDDADIPQWDYLGIGEVLANGVTAWGFKVLEQYEKALQYMERDAKTGKLRPLGMQELLDNFKPNARSGAYKMGLTDEYKNIIYGNI